MQLKYTDTKASISIQDDVEIQGVHSVQNENVKA